MIKKIFTIVILTLFLMIISIVPVKASDLFKVAITGVTNTGDGATSNYLSYNDNSVTFITELYLPGDYITYEIKVKNLGSIEAKLSQIDIEKTDNPAIIFDYQGINEGDILKAGEEITFKVRVTYNNEITTQPTDLTSEFKITLNYEQNGDSGLGDNTGDNGNSGGIGAGDAFDILGVSVPNTVAYVSLYIIIIGLLLIIIAIIVLKRTVSNKKENVAMETTTISNPPLNKGILKQTDKKIEVLDIGSNNEDIEILDLESDTDKVSAVLKNNSVNNEVKENTIDQ